jgi:hypothetical protein
MMPPPRPLYRQLLHYSLDLIHPLGQCEMIFPIQSIRRKPKKGFGSAERGRLQGLEQVL